MTALDFVANGEEHSEALLKTRRRMQDDTEIDITPMIDMTFLLIIFFLVASTHQAQSGVELAKARFGKGVSTKTSVIVTIAADGDGALVYLSDGRDPAALLSDDPEEQSQRVQDYVQQHLQEGKSSILIKAERTVHHRDVSRVAEAAGAVATESVSMFMAVLETNQ